jgi:hypothetical protein
VEKKNGDWETKGPTPNKEQGKKVQVEYTEQYVVGGIYQPSIVIATIG